MDTEALKQQIEKLDPKTHGALRDALRAEYARLTGEKGSENQAKIVELGKAFAALFRQAMDDISERYVDGTLGYVSLFYPAFYHKINEAEDKLNKIWAVDLREGKATIEEFKEALQIWHDLHIEAIALYAKAQAKQRLAGPTHRVPAQPGHTRQQQTSRQRTPNSVSNRR